MESAPITHILDRNDYSKHRLVALPSSPLPPLAPSSLRIQTKIIGLTTNNLTYAKLGFLMGWWDVYPLPPSTPAPYNDPSTHGRISAWGYASILESTVESIPADQTVYGYLPIATLPEDVQIEISPYTDYVFVTSPHRQHLWTIYNRYQICAPLEELEKRPGQGIEFLAWDALLQPLFGTAYNLNAYGFAWEDRNRVHPSGKGDWSASDADLTDSIVICLSASGKTGISFAHQVRNNRPKEHQPACIIGVCSEASKSMVQSSGFYDKTLVYSDASAAKSFIEETKPARVVLVDFGARSGATASWNTLLSTLSIPFTFVGVGGEVKPMAASDLSKMMATLPNRIQTNANELREKGIALGGDEYFETFHKRFDEFKAKGGIPGVRLQWGEGMEDWERGWGMLCRDEVRADTGLVYRL